MSAETTVQTTLQTAADVLAEWTQETITTEDNRLDVVIKGSDLLAAVAALQAARWGYLSTITGVDLGVDAGELEVLYHFCEGAAIVTLRVRIPRENPTVPSLYSIVPSVSFYERELIEMFGITIEGTPNTDRLFLPDDWPQGVYPMRKDFDITDAQG
jgi:NADH:ubiquinone oxidoreductase subunit C